MDFAVLQTEVQNDPESIGYAAHLPAAPGIVADLMNEHRFTMPKPTFVSARGVMASFGLGAAAGSRFLNKLEALAPAVPEIKWVMKFLETDAGIDIGEPAVQEMLASLAGVGGITQAEVDGIKAMAMKPASRAEVLFGTNAAVTEADLRSAGVV